MPAGAVVIIALEGGEAVGKKTQTELLAKRLGATLFSFPRYETETGKAILGHLKEHWACCDHDHVGYGWVPSPKSLDMMAFQSLMAANRYEAAHEIIDAAYRGDVVFDRYELSGIVYGTVEGLDPNWLWRLHAQLPQPDIQILLDAPVEESFKRRAERRDRNERDPAKLEKIRTEYLDVFGVPDGLDINGVRVGWATKRPGWYVVNALGTVEEVAGYIDLAIRYHMAER